MKIIESLFRSPRNTSVRITCLFLCLLLFVVYASPSSAKIKVTGTKEHKAKLAQWLSDSLRAKVTIDVNGNIKVEPKDGETEKDLRGTAKSLKAMADSADATLTIKLVSDKSDVSPYGTNIDAGGEVQIDIGDLSKLGNKKGSNGMTPDVLIMGAIVKRYSLLSSKTSMAEANEKRKRAMANLMSEYKTMIIANDIPEIIDGKVTAYYTKIRKTDGTYIVLKWVNDDYGEFMEYKWYKEKVPCKLVDGTLIPIPDPDPQVHILNYDPLLDHSVVGTIDTEDSTPTGIAFDNERQVYVTENFAEDRPDEVRVFSVEGELVHTYAGEEIMNPEGIAVDAESGEIFVAVERRVVRYDSQWEMLGTYAIEGETFTPTDVAIWHGYQDIDNPEGEVKTYDIFVTDRTSGQVYRFDVEEDMNNGAYTSVFGADYLDAPEGLYVASSGMVWVASTGNNRIYRFSIDGELLPLRSYEDFLNPEVVSEYFLEDVNRSFFDLERTTASDLYVVDHTVGKGALLRYDAFDATFMQAYGEGKFQCPASLATMWKFNLDNLELTASPDEEAAQSALWPWIIGGAVAIVLAVLLFVALRRKG